MNTFKKAIAAGVLTATVALGAQQSLAATDGTLGATSTGTSLVSLSIANKVRISGLEDFAFGAYSGTGDLTDDSDLCVYSNGAAGAYKVTISDSSTMSASGFSVQNAGATADIPYTVKWNNVIGTAGNQAVTYATQLTGTGANMVSADCSTGGKKANVQVNVAAAGLQSAPAGSYSTTLTLLVEP